MTDTPRTDEAQADDEFGNGWIEASFARELETEITTLRARIKELTEWRPMETAPERRCILRDYNGYITLGNGIGKANTKLLGTDKPWYTGWLPLPKGTET